MNSLPENPEPVHEDQPALIPDPLLPAATASVPAPPRDPAWNGWDILRIVILAFVALVISMLALLLVGHGSIRARANHLNAHPELLIVAQMVAYLLLLGYMYILVTKERRQPRFWPALRWNWPSQLWPYFLVGLLMQTVVLVIQVNKLLPFPKETPFDALLSRPSTVVLIALFAVTLGPLLEELFFRGFLYPVLRRPFGVPVAVVATAIPFALMHASQYSYSWASVLMIFFVGVVLAVVRETRNSLAASFLVHASYNGTIMLLLFIATSGFRHLEKLGGK